MLSFRSLPARVMMLGVRRVIGMLVIFIAASGCGSATRLPTLGGDVRPAWWANGDASWIVGGLDGTGQLNKRGYPNLGHVQWARWSSTEAIGWGVGWDRCIDSRGCPLAYTLNVRSGVVRLLATHPSHGQFQHLQIGTPSGFCVIYPDAESGDWYLAKCDTWKRDVGR
jgi:hypothetical protein